MPPDRHNLSALKFSRSKPGVCSRPLNRVFTPEMAVKRILLNLRRADTVRVGDPVDVLLSQGGLRCEVKAMDAAGWNAAAPSDPTE